MIEWAALLTDLAIFENFDIRKLSDPPTERTMTLVKLRERAQLTLPRESRKALEVADGDYLEACVVEGGVLFKPVAVVDREAAKARLLAFLDQREYRGPQPPPDDDALMEEVVAVIKEVRREGR